MTATPACSCGSALCPRCGKAARDREGWCVIEPLLLAGIPLAVLGFWPAFIPALHGQTDTGGFRWTATTTVACSAWWGVLLLFALIIWAGHRPDKTKASPPEPGRVPPGTDPAVTMHLLDRLDEIDGYAAEAEKARTGEELDYLIVYGRLPGRKKNPQ